MKHRVLRPVTLMLFTLVVIGLLAVLAGGAAALPTFTQAQLGIGPCDSCHTMSGTHTLAVHSSVYPTCSNCHVNGDTTTPPTPAKCATCHGGATAILSAHPSKGCSTTVGCHGVVVAVPAVTGFTPLSAGPGTRITVTGTGFPGATQVTFNGVATTNFTVDTPTQLFVTVPAGASTGPIAVSTSAGTGTSVDSFTVTQAAPKITKLTPASGKRGVSVVVAGSGFGDTRGTSFVKFGSVKVSKYLSWTASKVKVRVPSKAKFGKIKVTLKTTAGTSNAKTFTVKR